VTSIGSEAFKYSGLTSITIPANVTTIGFGALVGCDELQSITVAPANADFSSSNGMLLNKLQTQLIACPSQFAGNCLIPVTVTGISNYAFAGCSLLTGVALPPGLSQIGGSVFEDCSALASVSIPSGVTAIGQWAFRNCSSLASVTIPATVTSIGHTAFSKCDALTEVTIPASVSSIAYSFVDCRNLTAIHVDVANPTFSSLDGVLFNKQQTELLAVPAARAGKYPIPPSVKKIQSYAFLNCDSLTAVSIPSGLTHLESFAFSDCGKLESITIPASVISLSDFALGSCALLKRAIFLGGAPSMGMEVFQNAPAGFHVYYFNGAAGFSSPTWFGYPSVNMGAFSAEKPWLVSYGFSHDADLHSDPNQDGVNLLLAYGLDLDPTLNLASSMPTPVVANGGLSIRFYAGNPNVTYSVQASSTLSAWTSEGVVLSALDENQWRIATIPTSATSQFLRLVIEE
jgi:hypothetical protein